MHSGDSPLQNLLFTDAASTDTVIGVEYLVEVHDDVTGVVYYYDFLTQQEVSGGEVLTYLNSHLTYLNSHQRVYKYLQRHAPTLYEKHRRTFKSQYFWSKVRTRILAAIYGEGVLPPVANLDSLTTLTELDLYDKHFPELVALDALVILQQVDLYDIKITEL